MRSNEEVRQNFKPSDLKWEAQYETGLHADKEGIFYDRWGCVKYKVVPLWKVVRYICRNIRNNEFCNERRDKKVIHGSTIGQVVPQNQPYRDSRYGEKYVDKIYRLFGIVIHTNHDVAKFVADCRLHMDCDHNWVLEEYNNYISSKENKELL